MPFSPAHYEDSDLFENLNVFFCESMNLARIKFISLMGLRHYSSTDYGIVTTQRALYSYHR